MYKCTRIHFISLNQHQRVSSRQQCQTVVKSTFSTFGCDGPNDEPTVNVEFSTFLHSQHNLKELTWMELIIHSVLFIPCENGCSKCVNIQDIPYNNTIRFVLSAVSRLKTSHPIHIHSYSFQVLDIGYGSYSKVNGSLTASNSAMQCSGRCPLLMTVSQRSLYRY